MKLNQERFEYGCMNDYEWYFMLKSPKGKLIFHSDAYTSEEDCRRVIHAVKQYAMNAEVVQVDRLEQY